MVYAKKNEYIPKKLFFGGKNEKIFKCCSRRYYGLRNDIRYGLLESAEVQASARLGFDGGKLYGIGRRRRRFQVYGR